MSLLRATLLAALLAAPGLRAADWMPGGDAAAELEKGLGGGSAIAESEKADLAQDKLAWGGTLSAQYLGVLYEGRDAQDHAFANPTQAFLWLDSRLEGGARVLARGKALYDPSTATPLTPAAVAASLEELKLSFSAGDVFVTAGRQKIKHGPARFYNPSDFLNVSPRDFFLQVDERPGVDLLRLQVPVGKANYYAGALPGRAGHPDQVGGWGRAEWGYAGGEGWLGGGEVSTAVLARKWEPTKLSADLSQAVGLFDVYGEGAFQPRPDGSGKWDAAYTVGLSAELRYADRSTNTVTLQAEYFQAGDTIETGGLVAYLPKPFSLQDTRFLLYNLYHFYDQSGLSRLDVIYQVNRQITASVWGAGHWGVVGGLYRQPYQMADLGLRLDANF